MILLSLVGRVAFLARLLATSPSEFAAKVPSGKRMSPTRLFAIGMIVTGLAASASAQAIKGSVGNLYGKVTDESGAALPGVRVTLSGVGAPQSTTSGGQGDFRFLNLSAGSYTTKGELSGFATVEQTNVVVSIGTNVEVTIPMKIASVETKITVTSEMPLLDTRRERQATSFDQESLKGIPSSRDPWGLLAQTAGVLLDKIQTGSQSSGAQSVFIGKGSPFSSSVWNVDGVALGVGGSPAYWDFDAFEEIQVTAGGSDPSLTTPGVTLNMVTKRGTNDLHGSARVFLTPSETEASSTNDEAKEQGVRGGRIDNIKDYGAEAGGPVVADKAWLWGSFGHTDIDLVTATGISDQTQLENYAAKLNLQPIPSNSMSGFYFHGDKTKLGRAEGFASQFADPKTTGNQLFPSHIWKLDDSQVVGASLVANVAWSYYGNSISVVPAGGTNPPEPFYRSADGAWHNSFQTGRGNDSQHQVQGTGSYFFDTGAMGHEVKFGGHYINHRQHSTHFWPGNGVWGEEVEVDGHDPNYPGTAHITRAGREGETIKTVGGFLGDTVTMSNLTVNLGVRYDSYYGANLPSNVSANAVFQNIGIILPALQYPGGGAGFRTQSWQPRMGLSYAVGPRKKTLLRASYARFADPLGLDWVRATNPTGGIADYQFQWKDTNGNHIVDASEICIPGTPGTSCAAFPSGFDPTSAGNPVSPNRIDADLRAAKTDEIIVGVDREILPEFVVGLSYTYRHRFDLNWQCPVALDNSARCIARADYSLLVPAGTPAYDINGNIVGRGGPVYGITGGVGEGSAHPNYSYGLLLTNRDDYSTNYHNVELQFTKRLSHRWMAHGSFDYNSWKQKVRNVATGCIDPTNQTFQQFFSVTLFSFYGNSCAGGDVAYDYSGLTYINAKWQFNVNGLYQLPYNFNLAGNIWGRQGYPLPYFVGVDPGDGFGTRLLAVDRADAHRLKNVYELDLGIQKVIRLFQKADVTLVIDVFNVLNSAAVTVRQSDGSKQCDENGQNCTGAIGAIEQVQNPRVLRFGARVSF
jgi:hypothetical protein